MADDNATTASEVIETVNKYLESAEATESDLASGVRVVVPDSDAGRAFGLFRRNEFEFESTRGPSSESLVFNIQTDSMSPSEKIPDSARMFK